MDCTPLNTLDVGENVDLKVLITHKFEHLRNHEAGSYSISREGKSRTDSVVPSTDMCD